MDGRDDSRLFRRFLSLSSSDDKHDRIASLEMFGEGIREGKLPNAERSLAIPRLLELIDDLNGDVRFFAVAAIGDYLSEAERAPILGALAARGFAALLRCSETIDATARRVVGVLTPAERAPMLLPLMIAATDKNNRYRSGLIEALSSLSGVERALFVFLLKFTVLSDALEDADARAAALKAVDALRAGERASLHEIVANAMTSHSHVHMRTAAARIVARMVAADERVKCDPQLRRALIQALGADKEASVRAAALDELCGLGASERTPYVAAVAERLEKDASASVRRAALQFVLGLPTPDIAAHFATASVPAARTLVQGDAAALEALLSALDPAEVCAAAGLYERCAPADADAVKLSAAACAKLLEPSQTNPAVKRALLRVFGNADIITQAGFDLAPWFGAVKGAAGGLLDKMAAALHAEAVTRGQAVVPAVPPSAAPKTAVETQADVVAYMRPDMQELVEREAADVAKQVEYDGAGFTPTDLLMTALLLQSEYVHTVLSESIMSAEAMKPFGELTAPEPKSLTRMGIKASSDYKDEPVPAACLLDTVRRSVVASDDGALEQQRGLLKYLASRGVKITRVKSTMDVPDASVKQTIVNLLVFGGNHPKGQPKKRSIFGRASPSKKSSNGRQGAGSATTFKGMLSDPRWFGIKVGAMKRNNLKGPAVDSAETLFRRVGQESVAMIVELQLYIDYFLQQRRLTHGLYKVARANTAAELVRDTERYSTKRKEAWGDDNRRADMHKY